MTRRKPGVYSEVSTYWRNVLITLYQRGLLKSSGGTPRIPHATAIVCPEYVLFALDPRRTGGIPRERWLDERLWRQIGATLPEGRRVFVSDGGRLGLVIGRYRQERKRLPRVVHLAPEHLSGKDFQITLGYARRGPVRLDVADRHRDILTGGSSGSGKTNMLQSVVLQLAAKHTPEAFQVAIVDTKEVDFAGDWHRLPHLFQPVAHGLEEAAELIEQVEAERIRRKAELVAAGVDHWRDLPAPSLPLLLLVVDEAADFAGDPAMETLEMIGRKGRSFGISVIVGTQYPTSRVISPQLKANLATRVAFRTSTGTESRVILDRTGAEELHRTGLALTFPGVEEGWCRVQVLKADDDMLAQIVVDRGASEPVLSDVERALVRYAVEELGEAFKIDPLYEALGDRISRRQIVKRARSWERRGWLTEPRRDDSGHPLGRQVTDDLAALASPPARKGPPSRRESGKAVKAVRER